MWLRAKIDREQVHTIFGLVCINVDINSQTTSITKTFQQKKLDSINAKERRPNQYIKRRTQSTNLCFRYAELRKEREAARLVAESKRGPSFWPRFTPPPIFQLDPADSLRFYFFRT